VGATRAEGDHNAHASVSEDHVPQAAPAKYAAPRVVASVMVSLLIAFNVVFFFFSITNRGNGFIVYFFCC
jgi:hypothetical protein